MEEIKFFKNATIDPDFTKPRTPSLAKDSATAVSCVSILEEVNKLKLEMQIARLEVQLLKLQVEKTLGVLK